MKQQVAVFLIAFFGLATAVPVPAYPAYTLRGREVPQEHSHNSFIASVRTSLRLNNPNQITDPIFGLLGSAAAAGGKGKISDVDCLHLATADQAFTNAKAAKDISGMTDALIYAALERNTQGVGTASVLCTSIKAVNKEVGAISQHQDPASTNAAAINKAIVLELAKQIASIGGDPQLALKSGTFKPGNRADTSGKGNTCDTEDDTNGCIFTLNLLVEDATPAEITAAVSGGKATAPAEPIVCRAVSARSEEDDASDEIDEDEYDEYDESDEAEIEERSDDGEIVERSACPASAPSLDLGSCSDPTIKFANGLDGRNQPAFAPNNPASFNHGSALNIGVISSFICGQLSSACKASAAAIADCAAGESAASKLTGQAAADAFNAAFGASPPAAPAAPPPAAPPASAASAAGSNVQTFTGALGGLPPPVIESNSERPFSVNGSTFLNKAAAIQRSCAIQHNACADAANSGKLAGGVGQCDTQEDACNAAGGA